MVVLCNNFLITLKCTFYGLKSKSIKNKTVDCFKFCCHHVKQSKGHAILFYFKTANMKL